jgi:hypothetical protein
MNAWAGLMMLAGGLFAGGTASFAWSRVPIWRTMPAAQFIGDFSATIRWTDKVQPALLLAAIVSATVYAFTAGFAASVLALFGAGGFLVTLVASVVVLVPLQRRIMAASPRQPDAVEEMRRRWCRGHLGRSALSVASFVILVAATL